MSAAQWPGADHPETIQADVLAFIESEGEFGAGQRANRPTGRDIAGQVYGIERDQGWPGSRWAVRDALVALATAGLVTAEVTHDTVWFRAV